MSATLYERLDRCNHEIKKAAAENKRVHTEAERAGILIWEMDERSIRESIVLEIAAQEQTIWERR
jgi:hypothetical protein